MVSTSTRRSTTMALAGVGLVAALFVGAVSPASAAPTGGLLDLGSAAGYSVLAGTAVTNTGTSTVTGNLGIWPGTALTGFDSPSKIGGVVHLANTAAEQAQRDTTAAYGVAALLPPTLTGLDNLSGRTLTPGIYAGGAMELSDNDVLTLDGSANSLWVFQASSSLTIGSGARINVTGGASACNVFWQVASSATIGTGAQFQGTVLAQTAITTAANATITGRLLARTAAVTLHSDSITIPICATAAPQAPAITSGPPANTAMVGIRYEHTVTASGNPVPTFTLSAGALPAGLLLNDATGVISGIPTTAGSSTFTISAGNGTGPNATAEYTLITTPAVVPGAPGTPPVAPTVPEVPAGPGAPGTPTPTPTVPGNPALPGAPLPAPAPADTPASAPAPAGPQGAAPAPTAGSQPRGAGESTGSALAETGTNVTPILVAGGVILLAGAALVTVMGIRRRQARTGSK